MRARINWGVPVYVFSFIILLLNFCFAYYFILYYHPVIFLFFIPAIALDIIMYPVYKSVFNRALDRNHYDLLISNKGIELNRRLHLWDAIKSISFQTGRLAHDYTAFQGIKLPALQKIYLLDREGKEYSCAIDIDYSLRGKRNMNNLIFAKEELIHLGKIPMLSDWAEKR